jgi:DNA invertase Pin-like site-specific DNA recombinase
MAAIIGIIDLISARTKEALKARKAAGVKLGRPRGPGKSKLDLHRDEIVALLANGSTKAYIAKKYTTTRPNLYNWMRKNRIEEPPPPTRLPGWKPRKRLENSL